MEDKMKMSGQDDRLREKPHLYEKGRAKKRILVKYERSKLVLKTKQKEPLESCTWYYTDKRKENKPAY